MSWGQVMLSRKIYLTGILINKNYFLGDNPYKYIVSKFEAVDIDDREDFEVARALLGLS